MRILGWLIVVALFGLIFWAVILIFQFFQRIIESGEFGFFSAIVVASITAIFSVVSVLISRAADRRNDLEKEVRGKRIDLYIEISDFMFNLLQQGKPSVQKINNDQMSMFIITASRKLTIWASSEVLKSWIEFTRSSNQLDANNPSSIRKAHVAFEKVFRAIRNDLGSSNKGLREFDILGIFVNDINSIKKQR